MKIFLPQKCNCTTQNSKIAGRYKHKTYKTNIFLLPECDVHSSLLEAKRFGKSPQSDLPYAMPTATTLCLYDTKVKIREKLWT